MISLCNQIRNNFSRLTLKIVFYGLLAMILVHFIGIVNRFWGMDIAVMYEPMKLRLMAEGSNPMTMRIIQLFPFLVVLPAGFSFMNDRNNDTDVLIISRTGNKSYVRNHLAASFISSFCAYWIPFMLEILLLSLAFEGGLTGDPSGISDYSEVMQSYIDNYLFSDLYEKNSVLYAIFDVTMWGVTFGVLGCFTTAVSFFGFRMKALLFLPAYLLIYAMSFIEKFADTSFTTNYMWYMISYDVSQKSNLLIWIFDLAVMVICVVTGFIFERRDRL